MPADPKSFSTPQERQVASFLVRFWLEPREIEGETAPLRAYIRHLQSGEEQYASDLETMIERMMRQLRGK